MKLSQAARYFDHTVARDAYGIQTFPVQMDPVDLFKIDGAAVKRRTLTTDVAVQMPARRTIGIDEQIYLVGDRADDYWFGKKIRLRYVLQGADETGEVKTFAQALADTEGLTAYCSVNFVKYSTDERDDAKYHPQYEIVFADGEGVQEDHLVFVGDDVYLVKYAQVTLGGFLQARANKLPAPVVSSASFKVQTYNPATDSYSESSSLVRCLRARWQEAFEYLTLGSHDFERGDEVVFLASDTSPKGGDLITMDGVDWRILSVVAMADHKRCHCRRA